MTTRIFLSYGRGDDDPDFYDPAKSFMRRLYNSLKTAGFEVWWDRENLPGRGLSFLQEIRDAVTAHDKLVLVVGEKGMASDYVRAEWEYALSICKTVVPLLRNGDYNLMPSEIALANAPDFRDLSLFDHKLAELVRLLNESDAPMGMLYGVSDLPRGYIERKADMQAVSAMIRSDAVKPTVVTAAQGRSAAVYGLGGIGKTILTRALCYDCDLRRSFPDGIIWLEIGKTPLITSRQADIGEIFGDSRDKYVDEKAGKARLSQILSDKKALIILDDIWEQEHVEHFRVFAQGCRLLISTRIQRLANTLGANNYELDKLSEEQGIQLIAARFDKNPADIAELKTLREIVNLLDGHTLAISIAATQLQEHNLDFAPRLLERMKTRLDGENPFKDLALEETDKNLNLELSLSLSYDDLKPDLRRRFSALGILTPDGSFDAKLAAAIWGDAEETFDDAEDALNTLVQKRLLIREQYRFSQHNLLRAYARALLIRTGEIETHFTRYTNYLIELTKPLRELPLGDWGTIELDVAHIIYVGDELYRAFSNGAERKAELEIPLLNFNLNMTRFLQIRREIHRTEWLEKALEISQARGMLQPQGLFLNELGTLYSRNYEIRKALTYFENALPIAQALDQKQSEATLLTSIGKSYADMGEIRKGLGYYEQALPLHREIHNRDGEANTLDLLAAIYNHFGENDKALEYHEQALTLYREVYNRDGEARILNNIAGIYEKLGRIWDARESLKKGLELSQSVGDKFGEAVILNNIGNLYYRISDFAEAADTFEQASIICHNIGAYAHEAASRKNRSFSLVPLDRPLDAIDELHQCIAILQEHNLPYDASGNTIAMYETFIIQID